MQPSSKLSRENADPKPYPWLEEKVYAKLRQRTIRLVKQSVDALLKDKQRVSLSMVVAKSKELDPDHRGVSESAILDNQEARVYYEQHRTWQGSRKRRAKPLVVASPRQPGPVKPGRNEQRTRQRYLRMSKETLAERLITTERMLAEERERWLLSQDVALTWRLRAEAAETQLQTLQERLPEMTRNHSGRKNGSSSMSSSER